MHVESGGATDLQTLCPFGRLLCVIFKARPFRVRVAQQSDQSFDFAGVAPAGGFNGLLRQMIAQHIKRVDTQHGFAPFSLRESLGLKALLVAMQPLPGWLWVVKQLEKRLWVNRSICERTERQGEIRTLRVQKTPPIVNQLLVFLEPRLQAKLAPQVTVVGLQEIILVAR